MTEHSEGVELELQFIRCQLDDTLESLEETRDRVVSLLRDEEQEPYLSQGEAAEKLGVCRRTLQYWSVPSLKVGRQRLYRWKDLTKHYRELTGRTR